MITGASERRSSCGSAADEHDALRRAGVRGANSLRVSLPRDSRESARDSRGVRASRCHVPDPSSVELVVAHSIKLAIFDFDQTILAIHAFGQHIEPEAVASRSMEADFTDLAFFTALVHLLREKGVSVAIASFGRYEVIQAYMDRAFGIVAGDAASEATRIFTRASISTPTSVGGHDGFVLPGGKNPQLQALAAVYGLAPVNIFFFDDDRTNVDLALTGGFTYSVHCPEGFDYSAWAGAAEFVAGAAEKADGRTSRRSPGDRH